MTVNGIIRQNQVYIKKQVKKKIDVSGKGKKQQLCVSDNCVTSQIFFQEKYI